MTSEIARPQYHFIGIGGAGMSVVAELMLAKGWQISGSDRSDSAVLAHLCALGVDTYVGHTAHKVPAEATVVVSSAIASDNPELLMAKERGQTIMHRSQALALAAADKDFVAVAGAHGKTTTSAMLAMALAEVGMDPSWAIGGRVLGYESGARKGQGQIFVAEADESDASFLNYQPKVEIITNIEPDHLDHYGSAAAFAQAFVDFASRVASDGSVVLCADDGGCRQLAQKIGQSRRIVAYGEQCLFAGEEALPAGTVTVQILDMVFTQRSSQATLLHSEYPQQEFVLQIPILGRHNVSNATAAFAAGLELGAKPEQMIAALAKYTGTARRFEPRGNAGGVEVVDDYAHHPTEVAATMRLARNYTQGRVLVLFQPHLYSRTKNFAAEFAQALAQADVVVVCGVYAAREAPINGVQGNLITEAMAAQYDTPSYYVEDRFAAAEHIASLAVPLDLLITMGAGDVTELGPVILRHLDARQG